MDFNVYSYTNQGGRDYNEDYSGYRQEGERGAFVLADGLGGHGFGEVASKLAVDYILSAMGNVWDATEETVPSLSDDVLITLIDGANKAILECQNANLEYKNMRTTIAAAFVTGDIFRYINVGDSRVYYFKNGCLYAQSKDHSVSQMAVDLGEITQEEIRYHDDRSKLLKVLGDVETLNITKTEPQIKIDNGDAFLLCSDGFWEYVFETEMELDLVKSSTPEEWCGFMCRRLLRRVTGNNDNFTVLCGMAVDAI